MNSKPLSYENRKWVLFHMEGNKRIELSHRCPSIRMTEKIVPLQLNRLGFLENGFELNNITYEIGIHQKYHVGQTPDSIRQHNKNGGYSMDLDSFGLEDGQNRDVLTPGDIVIKNGSWEENNEPLEGRIRGIQEFILKVDKVGTNLEVCATRNELIFLKHLHENAPVPFENVICLTRSTFLGSKKVEFYRYNMAHHEAVKKLAILLFGERLDPIGARRISIQQSNVFRLPPNLKIKNISKADIFFEPKAVCEALSKVFFEPNLLLERVFIIDPRVEDLTTPIIKNAKYVEISRGEGFARRNRDVMDLEIFTNVTNQTAHFEMSSNELPLQDLIALIRHWKEAGRQIGTSLFMMFQTKQLCMDHFLDVVKQFERARFIEGNKAVIPLSVDSAIELSWSHEQGSRYNFRTNFWKLKMEVKAIDQ